MCISRYSSEKPSIRKFSIEDAFGPFCLSNHPFFPVLMKFLPFPARSSVFQQFCNERTGINITFQKIEEIPRIVRPDDSMIGNLTDTSARFPVVVTVDAMG
jgi:hypothetical protein